MRSTYDMIPQKISDGYWSVKDSDGEEKAYAVLDEITGLWTAYINSKICAESMDFITSRSDNPGTALSNLLAYNLELAREKLAYLEDIYIFMDLSVFCEDDEDIETDILAII